MQSDDVRVEWKIYQNVKGYEGGECKMGVAVMAVKGVSIEQVGEVHCKDRSLKCTPFKYTECGLV